MGRQNNKELTKEDIQILRYIYNYILEKGYPPAFSEISDAMYWSSKQTCFKKLQRLKENGYINYAEKVARSLQITHFSICLKPTDTLGKNLEKIFTK